LTVNQNIDQLFVRQFLNHTHYNCFYFELVYIEVNYPYTCFLNTEFEPSKRGQWEQKEGGTDYFQKCATRRNKKIQINIENICENMFLPS